MQIARHAPESCPDYSDKYRKETVAWMENADKIAAKYGIKIVGFWNDHPDHCVYIVYDTPSMDAIMAMGMDPMTMPLYAFQTMSTRPVLTAKEVLAMMKK